LYSSISIGRPIAFAVSQVSTTDVAPVSTTIGALTPLILACSANSPALPRAICTAGAGSGVRCRSIFETCSLARAIWLGIWSGSP
jgi:hypothetical protein